MVRINDFSDAVFAVAMTLLILTVDLPRMVGRFADHELPEPLAGMWPRFLAYALSVFIVGIFWMTHHFLFSRLRRYDKRLIWLNHVLVMLIFFLTFPPELMSSYGDSKVATAFYASAMAACCLMVCLLWWYATQRDDFSEGGVSPFERKDAMYSFLSMICGFALSLFIVPFSASAAMYFWISIWPLSSFIGRNHHKQAATASLSADPGE